MSTLHNIYNDIEGIVKTHSFLRSFPAEEISAYSNLINQSLHEARWAIDCMCRYDVKGKKVLEIGAGAGIVSACLHLAGSQVTMVEPSAGVFSYQKTIAHALHRHLNISIPVIDAPVETLEHETQHYHFIFSINVLEHIMDIEKAFAVMESLLHKEGIMFHTCPNYLVPYEPHAGTLLVPFFPKATVFVSKKLRTHPVTTMLNYITVPRIKKLATQNNLSLRFYKDMMYKSFMRLEYDSQFLQRQRGLPLCVFTLLKRLKIIWLTKYVPVCMQTPIAFEMRKR